MKNVKWLLTVLFIFSICIPSFAGHVPLHGHLKKKQRSVNLDVPIKADIDETSSSIISLDECTSGSYGLYISDSENYAEGFFNL